MKLMADRLWPEVGPPTAPGIQLLYCDSSAPLQRQGPGAPPVVQCPPPDSDSCGRVQFFLHTLAKVFSSFGAEAEAWGVNLVPLYTYTMYRCTSNTRLRLCVKSLARNKSSAPMLYFPLNASRYQEPCPACSRLVCAFCVQGGHKVSSSTSGGGPCPEVVACHYEAAVNTQGHGVFHDDDVDCGEISGSGGGWKLCPFHHAIHQVERTLINAYSFVLTTRASPRGRKGGRANQRAG